MSYIGRRRIYGNFTVILAILVAAIFCGMVVLKLVSLHYSSVFQKNWRVNLLFKTRPLMLVSFPKNKTEKVIFVTLPDDLYVQVPWGYGMYRLASTEKLAQLEHKTRLTEDTIEDLLHLKISASVSFPTIFDLKTNSAAQLTTDFKNANSFTKLIWDRRISTLNLYDRIFLSGKLAFLRADEQVLLNASADSALYTHVTLPDQSRVMILNQSRLEQYLEHRFEDEQIHQEALLISVFNTTDTSNVASEFAQILTAIGGKVISTGNQKMPLGTCKLIVKTEKAKSKIIQFLQREYACSLELSQTDPQEFSVYVGDKFAKRWVQTQKMIHF